MEVTPDLVLGAMQLVSMLAVVVALMKHLLNFGRALGKIEKLIEIHHEEIKELRKIKVDRSICEATQQTFKKIKE